MCASMYLVQLLLPLDTNLGKKFDPNVYSTVRDELVDRLAALPPIHEHQCMAYGRKARKSSAMT